METLEQILSNYKRQISEAEKIQQIDNYNHREAIDKFNLSIAYLQTAKSYMETNEEILKLSKENVKFKSWLNNKIQSVDNNLKKLDSYVFYLTNECMAPTKNSPRKRERRSRKARSARSARNGRRRRGHDDQWKDIAEKSIDLLYQLHKK